MLRSGRIFAIFWRRKARSKKEPVASGVVHCPCGRETPVEVYEARTRRRETSPDLVAFDVGGVQGAGRVTPPERALGGQVGGLAGLLGVVLGAAILATIPGSYSSSALTAQTHGGQGQSLAFRKTQTPKNDPDTWILHSRTIISPATGAVAVHIVAKVWLKKSWSERS